MALGPSVELIQARSSMGSGPTPRNTATPTSITQRKRASNSIRWVIARLHGKRVNFELEQLYLLQVNKIKELHRDQSLHNAPDFSVNVGAYHQTKHDHEYRYPGVDSFLKVGQKNPFSKDR